jgi:hypothetical protein
MKKICLSLVFALLFLSAAVGIKAQSPVSAFTGTWVFDKEKTNTSKDFPQKLKNYKMLVGESENQLHVKSQIEGPVELQASRDRAASNSDIVSNSSSRTTAASPTGVSATTVGAAENTKPNYGGTMALYFTPNEATYNLSGEEVKVEIKQGDKVSGIARVRAKLDKNGKTLKLTTIRRTHTPKGEMEVTVWEVWKISDDGKSLRFQRTVEAPAARDEIIMFLTKSDQ